LIQDKSSCAFRFRKVVLMAAFVATVGTGGCALTRSAGTSGTSGTGASSSDASATPGADAVLTASTSNLSFGNVPVGTATSELVSLTNSGAAYVHIATVNISGTGYSVSGGSNITLSPNQSVNVAVNFGPSSAGYASGTLSVSSDATNSVLQVGVSGMGVTATAQVGSHEVTLSWTPSASQVAGYNVYRSLISGGPYIRINSALDPNATYTDTNLPSGNYFYVATSVDSSGDESGYSNEVAVVIP